MTPGTLLRTLAKAYICAAASHPLQMALSRKRLRTLPQLAAGACLLIFVYHLLSRYAGVAFFTANEQNFRLNFDQTVSTQGEAIVEVAGAAAAAPQAAEAATPRTMSTATQMLRPITKVVEGMRLSEGAGVQIRRTVSQAGACTSPSQCCVSICIPPHSWSIIYICV
jgi:hypothetical protein